ncbi:hypothetical protein HAX54_023171 [Datura stramonium]|uniref:Uncharacterized protein n=1 Tax=Datura stramonium TaxID=4076 RepID=A0ABS8UY68_DATST|nr:hypothetical protein [Datura stramonium]
MDMDFDKQGLEVDNSLFGCCRYCKELVEDDRVSGRFQHIGKACNAVKSWILPDLISFSKISPIMMASMNFCPIMEYSGLEVVEDYKWYWRMVDLLVLRGGVYTGDGFSGFAGVVGGRSLLVGEGCYGGKCSGTGESSDGKRGGFGAVLLGSGSGLWSVMDKLVKSLT